MGRMRIALIGNPNVGKSTIFNALTGSNQQVGNWAGKTVERKVGYINKFNTDLELVDLPGTYSLTAYSQEEVITREYVLREKPDAVIAIVDASNIERNLYLVLQLLEMTSRVVIGLNMLDLAQSMGITISAPELSKALGVPVIEIVAAKKEGLDTLLEKTLEIGLSEKTSKTLQIPYPADLEEKILKMESSLKNTEIALHYPLRWLALKCLERDSEVGKEWRLESKDINPGRNKKPEIDSCCDTGDHAEYRLDFSWDLPIEKVLLEFASEGWAQEEFEMAFADAKYRYINHILPGIKTQELNQSNLTERVDRWILSPVWGYPLLAVILIVVFWVSFMLSAPLGGQVSSAMAWCAELFVRGMKTIGISAVWQSLVRDGIFAGVGAVLAFVPQIAIFFAFYYLLQDSGYLARAAFLGDRLMQMLGLHGKSFFSIVSSYGCNVPGIMATRTLEDPKDRLITMLINPLIPCVPRLGVISAVVAAFFPGLRGVMVLSSLLIISLLLVMFSALFLRRVVRQKEKSAFVMELPLYHIPNLRNILVPTWQRTFTFLKRAWTYILMASIIVWVLSFFPQGVPMEQSWAGRMGSWLNFIGHPLGFDWRIMVAVVFGFTAKETTLSTLGILYGVGADASQSIAQAMTSSMTSLVAYTFLVVYMLYIPCLATVVTTYKESGSLRWTIFGIVYNLLLSFIIGWMVFHIGTLAGIR